MKIELFGFTICFHKWIDKYDKYLNKIRSCPKCNKKQIKLYNSNKRKYYWINIYDS